MLIDDDIRALLDHGTPVPPEKFDTLVAFAKRVLDSCGMLDCASGNRHVIENWWLA